MAPEKFPEQAPDPVASHRLAEAFRHHQPQPGAPPRPWGQGDAEMPGMPPPPLGHGPEKIGPAQETISLGETGGPWGMGRTKSGTPAMLWRTAQASSRLLHAQTFAASGPAALQHPPAPFGAHPAQKAVGARPAQIAGLKCTFTHARLSLKPRFFQTFYKTFIPRFVKGKKVSVVYQFENLGGKILGSRGVLRLNLNEGDCSLEKAKNRNHGKFPHDSWKRKMASRPLFFMFLLL